MHCRVFTDLGVVSKTRGIVEVRLKTVFFRVRLYE